LSNDPNASRLSVNREPTTAAATSAGPGDAGAGPLLDRAGPGVTACIYAGAAAKKKADADRDTEKNGLFHLLPLVRCDLTAGRMLAFLTYRRSNEKSKSIVCEIAVGR
jgi:hypothetical protein